jgi:deoxyhypusine synthase
LAILTKEPKESVEVELKGNTARFVRRNYFHFNALTLKNATMAYKKLLDDGGKMFLSMAGAMSTGRLGISLAAMIRKGYVSGLSVTGANLEEDVFNLVANKTYLPVPDYRDITPEDNKEMLDKKMNRVTDVAIPATAMKEVEDIIIESWKQASNSFTRKFPHEFLTEILLSGKLKKYYQVDSSQSWLLAAAEMNIPIVTPGWEDSTLGNVFTALVRDREVDNFIKKDGIEAMNYLADWYLSEKSEKGFFQIGGGITGDFSICVVPFLKQDCQMGDQVKWWAYFCQISDAVTSYGGYSGATPDEKITWDKLGPKTPKFVIESDASIVAPLIFDQLLGI